MTRQASVIEALLEVMRRRRNIVKFKPDRVPDDDIQAIVEAARLAPSGANAQPWEFIVIKDAERKRQVAQVFIDAAVAGRGQGDHRFPFANEKLALTKVAEAPVLIAVCADPRFKRAFPGSSFKDTTLDISLGAAMEHMHLAATALGLGTCWGGVNQFGQEPMGELLGVVPPLFVTQVFSFGYPVTEPPPKFRRDLASVVHFEKLDSTKLRTDEEIAKLIASRRAPDIYAGRGINLAQWLLEHPTG